MNLWRAGARVAGAAVLLAALLQQQGAVAAQARPYDAPVVEAQHAFVPEVTPEYASIEETGIRLVYHPLARERAHVLLSRALAIRAELTAALGRDVLGEVQIRVAASPVQMAGLSPIDVPGGAPAVAFRDQHLVVMSLASPIAGEPPDLDERLRHELAHLALDEAIVDHDVPRWFHEGFAIQFSGEEAAQRAETLCLAALYDRLLGLRDVNASFPDRAPLAAPSIAAAEAADFVRFLRERPDRGRFSTLVERLRAGAPFERALPDAYETDLDHIELGWRREMAKRYSFVPVLAGSLALWMLVAAGVLARRRRRRRNAQHRALGARPFAAFARLSVHERAAPRHPAADEDALVQVMPPEPEVPRVEHRGRWYTLH